MIIKKKIQLHLYDLPDVVIWMRKEMVILNWNEPFQ